MKYCQVAVNIPLKKCEYTYSFTNDNLKVGDLVNVPLRNRKTPGCVTKIHETYDQKKFKVKPIYGVIENSFSLTSYELELYKWMSNYYHYGLGRIIFDGLPKPLKRPRKVDLVYGENFDWDITLTQYQNEIFEKINEKRPSGFSKHLIHGITGSGKSVIFLRLIKEVLQEGKSVHFLLPEINLTPQFVDFFKKYLNVPILSYHSGVTPSEKYSIWKMLSENNKPVFLMGVRSSIYLPIKNLGLTIVDEEHDQSFKQQDRCPYNARDVAIKRSSLLNTPIILGSATPSIESYYSHKKNDHIHYYYSLKQRIQNVNLPKITLVKEDKNDNELLEDIWPLTADTFEKINHALIKKEQVIIFVNRLGYSNFLQCRSCGYRFINEDCGCDLNLRYFKNKNILSCAHCDYKIPAPSSCPECSNTVLHKIGFGTEKVAEILSQNLNDYNVERFDRDEIKNFNDLKDKLDRFNSKQIDILVGTQMISKGHNFKNVNLVVILGVDNGLNRADFRAFENTYQQITQVAGRAGRYSKESEVIIQTNNSELNLFKLIKNNDFDGFYLEELENRKIFSYPPYERIAVIYFYSKNQSRVAQTIKNVGLHFKDVIQKHFRKIQMFGPTACDIEKRAEHFTHKILLKSDDLSSLHSLLNFFDESYEPVSGVQVKINVDPTQID